VAEPGMPEVVIRFRAATGNVLVDDVRPRKAALQGDGALTVLFHQPLKEPVSEQENLLAAVQRFTQAQEPQRWVKRGHEPVQSGVQGSGRIEGEGSGLLLDPFVESGKF